MIHTEPAEVPDETAHLTADVVLLGDFDATLWVLLIERRWEPFKGAWALPGGHVDVGEDTEDAARRELAEETGLRVGTLEYVGAFADPNRDPRGRYVTFAYLGRTPLRLAPTVGDDAADAEWVRIDDVLSGRRRLAFDHYAVIQAALSADAHRRVTNPVAAAHPNTPHGPFASADDAFKASAALRAAVREAGRDDSDDAMRAAMRGAAQRYVLDTLKGAGVELDAYDLRIAAWVADWDAWTIITILDWVLRARAAANPAPPVERARYSWVLYKPQPGSQILEAAGVEGTAVGLVDPVRLATDVLAKHSTGADAGDCMVKVYNVDERLVAWAQWEDEIATAYRNGDTR